MKEFLKQESDFEVIYVKFPERFLMKVDVGEKKCQRRITFKNSFNAC